MPISVQKQFQIVLEVKKGRDFRESEAWENEGELYKNKSVSAL